MRMTHRSGCIAVFGAALSLATGTAATAQFVPKLETTLSDGTTVRFYGQINQAVLLHDDGGETNSYALVDNSNSSSRLGIRSETPLDGGFVLKTGFEGEYTPNPSSKVSQRDTCVCAWDIEWTNLRKAEISVGSPVYGTVSLGQGSMASDGTAEVDFSGTKLVGYSKVSDTAGGQFFRLSGGALSRTAIGRVFTNFDGSRRLRMRYDTPSVAGFTLSGAYGQEVLRSGDENDYFDVGLTWSGGFETVKAATAVGYNWAGADSETVAASGSLLHTPTGASLTLAAGAETQGGDGAYLYGKLGIARDLLSAGATAVSVDLFLGSDIGVDGSDSTSYALALVQKIDAYAIDLYGTVRVHQFDERAADYDDGLAVMTGLRLSF